MLKQIEDYLKVLKTSERYMLYLIIIVLFGFIFSSFIKDEFENDMNFALLQKMNIEQKTRSVKKLLEQKTIDAIKKENTIAESKLDIINSQISSIDKTLRRAQEFDLEFLKNKYTYSVDGNQTTLIIQGSLSEVLEVIDDVNQHYKIDYLLLEAQKDATMKSILRLEDKIINISRRDALLSLESPFFNINNVFNITSIIGDSARVNGKWYSVDDNISSSVSVVDIKLDGIVLKDQKGKKKKIFFNK